MDCSFPNRQDAEDAIAPPNFHAHRCNKHAPGACEEQGREPLGGTYHSSAVVQGAGPKLGSVVSRTSDYLLRFGSPVAHFRERCDAKVLSERLANQHSKTSLGLLPSGGRTSS